MLGVIRNTCNSYFRSGKKKERKCFPSAACDSINSLSSLLFAAVENIIVFQKTAKMIAPKAK